MVSRLKTIAKKSMESLPLVGPYASIAHRPGHYYSPVPDIQEISCFSELSSGDILFVDSSYVSKTGSDVNMLLFQILPALPAGVHVHFHAIYYPFEHPRDFVYLGWAWNELYSVRAFLTYNREFSITLFPSFLERFHSGRLQRSLPLAYRDRPIWPNLKGASLWIRRFTSPDPMSAKERPELVIH